jgi:purine-nucleoside phosphorylase
MTVDHRPDVAARPSPGDNLPEEGAALIRERCDLVPAVALVLGSGLSAGVEADQTACHYFAYQGLPGFPPPSVPGHPGRLTLGELYGVPAAVFRGRIHLFEGHGVAAATLITRLAAALGARALILTNAAGGLGHGLRRGQLMVIGDHLNFQGVNPLAGWRRPDGTPAFVDLGHVYDPSLREQAESAAAAAGLDIATGVYAAVPGPTYETPAETRFLSMAGADAVGMSTVPEATAAAALGLRVLAVSCITNVAGAQDTHEDVLAAAAKAGPNLRAVLERVLPGLGRSNPS